MTEIGWTEERIEELKAMFHAGFSASQIARKLGAVSRNAVIGKLHRIGLKRGERPPTSAPGNSIMGAKNPSAKRPPRRALEALKKHSDEPEPLGPMNDFPSSGKCRYIHGELSQGTMQCCAHPVVVGTSWCEHHLLHVVDTAAIQVQGKRRPLWWGYLAKSAA